MGIYLIPFKSPRQATGSNIALLQIEETKPKRDIIRAFYTFSCSFVALAAISASACSSGKLVRRAGLALGSLLVILQKDALWWVAVVPEILFREAWHSYVSACWEARRQSIVVFCFVFSCK